MVSWRTRSFSKPTTPAKEVPVFLVGAESEHRLDHCAVVPGPIEQDHLPALGELGHVALQVPLGAL